MPAHVVAVAWAKASGLRPGPRAAPRTAAGAPLRHPPRAAVRLASLPPSPRSAACSLPGFPARRSARWCHPRRHRRPGRTALFRSDPPRRRRPCMTPLRLLAPEPPAWSPMPACSVPGRSRAAVPSYVGPGPTGGPAQSGAVRSAAPAASRRHAVPVGLTACRQVPDRSPPFLPPEGLPPPHEAPARMPPVVPSASAGHPADSPSYVFKEERPPALPTTFSRLFQDLFFRPLRQTFPQVNRGEVSGRETSSATRTAWWCVHDGWQVPGRAGVNCSFR
jgi:hypothetical protein